MANKDKRVTLTVQGTKYDFVRIEGRERNTTPYITVYDGCISFGRQSLELVDPSAAYHVHIDASKNAIFFVKTGDPTGRTLHNYDYARGRKMNISLSKYIPKGKYYLIGENVFVYNEKSKK